MTLRPLEIGDAKSWREVRVRNAAWMKPWDATVPPCAHGRPATFRVLVSPLVTWIWLGTFIVLIGGLITIWPPPLGARRPVAAHRPARVARELGRA